MKLIKLEDSNQFDEKKFKRFLLHDSYAFRILNFNLKAGQVFPVHNHPADGQLSIQVISGEGRFLGADGLEMNAVEGDVLISDISEKHGVSATTDMRILVTIAPPF